MTTRTYKGSFITFEGIDACGKSTQIGLLYEFLRRNDFDVIHLRDPGTTTISESIRHILLNIENSVMSAWTELLLYEAARAQLVEETIRPALQRGAIVLCDRFYDSTTAYQGYGRGLDLNMVQRANVIGSLGLVPDLTFFLDIDPRRAVERKKKFGAAADRLEAEGLAFQNKVRRGFREVQKSEPQRVKLIDGYRSIETIRLEIESVIANLLAISG
jgi:dTMP kinase